MGDGCGHVPCDVGDGLCLVRRLFVLEGRLELVLPGALAGEGVTRAGLAFGVEAQELLGHVAHGLLDASLDLLPGAGAELVECRVGLLPRPCFWTRSKASTGTLSLSPPWYERTMKSRRWPATSRVSRPSNRPIPWSWWTTKSPGRRSWKSERKLRARRPSTAGVEVNLLWEDVAVGEEEKAGCGSSVPCVRLPTRISRAPVGGRHEALVREDVAQAIGTPRVAEEEDGPVSCVHLREVCGERADVSRITPDRTGDEAVRGRRRRCRGTRSAGVSAKTRSSGLGGTRASSIAGQEDVASAGCGLLRRAGGRPRLLTDALGIEEHRGHLVEVEPRRLRRARDEREEIGGLLGPEAAVDGGKEKG